MEKHECVMKKEIDTKFDKLSTNTKWVIGVCAGVVLLLVVGMATLTAVQSSLGEKVTKINDDYASIIVIKDIYENNDRLIEIIQMLPQTSKDDSRYLEAIRDREAFQREALMRASAVKRGGSSNNSIGGSE